MKIPKLFKIAVCGSGYSPLDIEENLLGSQGGVVVDAANAEKASLIKLVRDADALLVGATQIDRATIEQMSRCKVIVEYGIGYDNIDVQAAAQADIMVANVPGYSTNEVADHALALLMALARKVCLLHRLVREGKWTSVSCKAASLIEPAIPIYRLAGKTVGILGLGRIGCAVARRVQGFEMKVIAYDPYVTQETMARIGVEKLELDEVISSSDFICLHLPLTPETKGLFNETRLKMMKRTAFFINLARGQIVEENALARALKEGWIAGAALDVLSTHPPAPDNLLLGLENVVVTPHTAWYSEEAKRDLRSRACHEVLRVLSGQEPESWVNKPQ